MRDLQWVESKFRLRRVTRQEFQFTRIPGIKTWKRQTSQSNYQRNRLRTQSEPNSSCTNQVLEIRRKPILNDRSLQDLKLIFLLDSLLSRQKRWRDHLLLSLYKDPSLSRLRKLIRIDKFCRGNASEQSILTTSPASKLLSFELKILIKLFINPFKKRLQSPHHARRRNRYFKSKKIHGQQSLGQKANGNNHSLAIRFTKPFRLLMSFIQENQMSPRLSWLNLLERSSKPIQEMSLFMDWRPSSEEQNQSECVWSTTHNSTCLSTSQNTDLEEFWHSLILDWCASREGSLKKVWKRIEGKG